MIEEAEQHTPREAQGDALSWGIINSVLLAGISVAIFLVLWQFGSQGYIYVTLGGIIIIALVGVVHWFFLRKQAIASSWVRITINEMHLEAVEPADRGLAPGGEAHKYLVPRNALVMADRQRGRVDKRQPKGDRQAAVQIHAQGK